MSLRHDRMFAGTRADCPFAPPLFQAETSRQFRLKPGRESGTRAHHPPNPTANSSRRKSPQSQELPPVGPQSPPVTVPEQVARVRPHLEVHQFIAAITRKQHAAIRGDGAVMVEQRGGKRILHRLGRNERRIVPAVEKLQPIH